MKDIILSMQNHYKTLRWIEETLFPTDPDYIIAVHQQSRKLTFANDRAHISGDWSNEKIYKYPLIGNGEFILLDVGLGVVNYILLRLGNEDDDVFVRITDNPRTLIFSNKHTNFVGWSGPPEFENTTMPPYPNLGSGQVVPGGNWIPSDVLYNQVFEELLGIHTTPEILRSILNDVHMAEDVESIFSDTSRFVDGLIERNHIAVDFQTRESILNGLNENQNFFRNINRHS